MRTPTPVPAVPNSRESTGRTIEQERAAYDARFAETEEAPEKKEKLVIDVSNLIQLGPPTAAQKERQDIIADRRRRESRS
jgi:hypothetical protein